MDTNVLLACTDSNRTSHREALAFLERGLCGERRLFASGQVFREYLVVATRPVEVNGLGLTTVQALDNLRQFRQCIQLLEEDAEVASQLALLIDNHQLKGKRIHDANLVATMRANGLVCIRTDNPDDFQIFEGLTIETRGST